MNEDMYVAGTSNGVWVAIGRALYDRALRVAINIDDVEDLVLSRDNNPDYRLVLSLKQDIMNTNFDFFVNIHRHAAVFVVDYAFIKT